MCSYFSSIISSQLVINFSFHNFFFTLGDQDAMILNIASFLISSFLKKIIGLNNKYQRLLNDLDLPMKVVDVINYFHVNLGRTLMLLLKPSTAQSAQQVNLFAVYESCTIISSGYVYIVSQPCSHYGLKVLTCSIRWRVLISGIRIQSIYLKTVIRLWLIIFYP